MWYVLHVLTGQEPEISHRLQRQGLTTMVPIEGRMIRTHGKWKQVDYTLLPGYVFVETEMDDAAYYLLTGTAGVIRILGTGKRPSPLAQPDVEWLRCLDSCLREPVTIEYLDHHTYRLVSGFLRHHTGCIERLDRHRRRIRIKFELLGETRRLELSYKVQESDLPF